jgi:hypothetical protein
MISAISNQHLVLTFGTASISAVFVAGFTQKGAAATGIFLALPVLSAWVLLMWLAEVVRMLRAVEFCRDQAAQIAKLVPVPDGDPAPIWWEDWRDEGGARRTITWTYMAVPSILILVYAFAVVRGLHVANWHPSRTMWVAIAYAVLLVAVGGFVGWTFKNWAGDKANVGITSRIGALAGIKQKPRRSK